MAFANRAKGTNDKSARGEERRAKLAYKVRSYVNGQSKSGSQYMNYALTVPIEIARALPEGIEFNPRMTEEGLLYEPVSGSTKPIELPAWAQQNSSNQEEAA